jgi:2'-5'-oligoadenylate synthase-like protein
MILFLSCFSSFEEQARNREVVISFIKKRLIHCSRSLAYNIIVLTHREGKRAPRSLTLKVQSRKTDDIIWMDILPAYDALGKSSGSFSLKKEFWGLPLARFLWKIAL